MKVKRINVNANEITEFNFDVFAKEFAVKNFTGGNILACLGDFDENKAVKIPTTFIELIFDNFIEFGEYTNKRYNKVTIKAEEAGEVEVRCIE